VEDALFAHFPPLFPAAISRHYFPQLFSATIPHCYLEDHLGFYLENCLSFLLRKLFEFLFRKLFEFLVNWAHKPRWKGGGKCASCIFRHYFPQLFSATISHYYLEDYLGFYLENYLSF
jgi:hypothetical protein